jgi:nitric oxide dioxygenase
MIVNMVAPAFHVFGSDILKAAYRRMLDDPSACALFGEQALRSRLDQAEDMAEVLFLMTNNIDRLDQVDPLFDQLARRHVDEGLTPEHHRHMGRAMLAAMRDVLGEGASDRILHGWDDGFWYLNEHLMERIAALQGQAQGASRAA